MTQLSLKSRMALGVALLFLCFGSVTGFFALTYFQQKFKESIGTHQGALLSSLANDLDNKLVFAQKSLEAFAPKLTRDVLLNEKTLQRALDDKTTLHLLFDALFIFSPEGKLLIESPRKLQIRGRDYSYRDYFKKTVASGKPQISAPFVSTYAPGHPAVMLTFPLFDAKGRLTAILAGHVDLLGENFLTDLRRLTIGKSGYVVLIDGNRARLIHPDRSLIMKQIPVGLNPLFDRAMAGFEGSGETATSTGLPVLASYKHLHAVNWLLVSSYPLEEAYAPVYRARGYFVSVMALGLVLMLLVSWVAMQRLISPLSRLTGHIKALAAEPGGRESVPVEAQDEIGTLAATFNAMMCALGEKQEFLQSAVARAERERANADAVKEQIQQLNAELEQRVRERTEELQQSVREMETFCYTVSHDLRTPLRGIHGFSSILQQDYAEKLDEEGKESLRRIAGAANRMGELIDDLLELSRVNRDELIRVPVDLTTLAGEIADDLTRSQPERKVEFVIQPGLRTTADPSLLGAVLANIIHNAWKFSSRNPAPRIEVGSRTEGGEQVFFVADNGVG
ncbi:HAMP domain-containing protein, partial [bacterium]|nr:HAMP domain-containing protein [bacterium]